MNTFINHNKETEDYLASIGSMALVMEYGFDIEQETKDSLVFEVKGPYWYKVTIENNSITILKKLYGRPASYSYVAKFLKNQVKDNEDGIVRGLKFFAKYLIPRENKR